MIENKTELLNYLKGDEDARRFLKHSIQEKNNEEVEELLNVKPETIIKLDQYKLYDIMDGEYVIKDELINEVIEILEEVTKLKTKKEEAKKIVSSPFIKIEWLKKWEEIINKNKALDYFSKQIAPKVIRTERAKKAILLSLASVEDQFSDRGRSHTLLIGPPGTAKSALGDYLAYSLGIQKASLRTTKVGLTGDASGNEITPGALPQADGETLFIDEKLFCYGLQIHNK